MQRFLRGVPIDVERIGVETRRSVLQDVPPPPAAFGADGHVVGDDVEHLVQSVLREDDAHSPIRVDAPELGTHLLVVDDVVAMSATGSRLQDRREIHVRDAEVREIRRNHREFGETEVLRQLHAIGGTQPVHRLSL